MLTRFWRLWIGVSARHKLDVHMPKNLSRASADGLPVVVFAHGGAWSWGHKYQYRSLCDSLCNALGAVVVNINYCVYPRGNVDQMVRDVQLAVRGHAAWLVGGAMVMLIAVYAVHRRRLGLAPTSVRLAATLMLFTWRATVLVRYACVSTTSGTPCRLTLCVSLVCARAQVAT